MDTEYPLTRDLCTLSTALGLVLGWAMWLQFRLRREVWETHRPTTGRVAVGYSGGSARLSEPLSARTFRPPHRWQDRLLAILALGRSAAVAGEPMPSTSCSTRTRHAGSVPAPHPAARTAPAPARRSRPDVGRRREGSRAELSEVGEPHRDGDVRPTICCFRIR